MKKLLSLLLCLVMIFSLAACGSEPTPTEDPTTKPTGSGATLPPPTTEPTTAPNTEPTEPPISAETVYNKVLHAMQNTEATRMKMDLGFGVSYQEGEGEEAVTTSITYNMTVDTIVSQDPFGSYATSSVAFDADGIDMSIDVEVYMIAEDGYVVTYTLAFGTWIRSESNMTVEQFISSGQMTEIDTNEVWSGDEMPADMTLDENTQLLDGTEVYILRTTIPADGLSDSLVEMGVEMDEEAEAIRMPVVYYVDAQNYTILRMEADMAVLKDLMSAAMAESLLGTGADADDVTIEISNAVYDLGYGPQDIPALPQEALDQSHVEDPVDEPIEIPPAQLPVAGEASDLGNGSFVLPCGTDAYTITCPAGWSGEVYATNNVWIYNEDQSLYGDFYYLADWTEDEIMQQAQMDEDDLKNDNIFISSGKGPNYLGFTTMQILGENESYYYAWTSVGEGYLLVLLADFTAEPDFTTMLNELLALVSPYTGKFVEPAPDGVFSLPCGDQTLTITCPEGWSGELYAENNVWIYNEDNTIYGDYYYLEGYTEEDILEYYVQYDIDSLTTENALISSGDGPAIAGFTTKNVIGKDVSYYYAWTPMGDGYFLAYVYDWNGGNDSATLLPQMLNCVTFDGSFALVPVDPPESGTILAGEAGGDSEITVTSASDKSYVVSLRNSENNLLLSFFVRAGETVTVSVPTEQMYVYFACGETWYGYGEGLMFGENTSYSKDNELTDFSTNTWTYTLQPSAGGNFSDDPTNAEDFFN